MSVPVGRTSCDSWVSVDAGLGAAYTGTRSSGPPPTVGVRSTRPLASDSVSCGKLNSWSVRPWVGSTALVSAFGSGAVSVTVTVLDSPPARLTEPGETE